MCLIVWISMVKVELMMPKLEKNMKTKFKVLIVVIVVFTLLITGGAIYLFGTYLPNKRKDEERTKIIREYKEWKLGTYQNENDSYEDYEVEVAFLGDSLTDGCNLNTYYGEYLTTNRGIGGDTTDDVIKRIKVSVYDLKPQVVVLLIGGNNLTTMFDNYEDILRGLKENLPLTKVVVVSLSAMGRSWAYKNEIAAYNNVKIKLLASKYDYEYVDIFTPLFDLETEEINANYTSDGVHFSHEGYLVVSSKIKEALVRILGH